MIITVKRVFIRRTIVFQGYYSRLILAHTYTQASAHTSTLAIYDLMYNTTKRYKPFVG